MAIIVQNKNNNSILNNKFNSFRINENIIVKKVRLVGEYVDNGIYSIEDALEKAKKLHLDLVEINSKTNPHLCQVVDYKKFLYEKKKKQKKINSKQIRIKEIRFGPQTDEHDYEFKKLNVRKFLEKGAKVKSLVVFKGRSILYKEQGKILLLRLAHDLQDCSKVAKRPYMEGKRMFILLIPITKKRK